MKIVLFVLSFVLAFQTAYANPPGTAPSSTPTPTPTPPKTIKLFDGPLYSGNSNYNNSKGGFGSGKGTLPPVNYNNGNVTTGGGGGTFFSGEPGDTILDIRNPKVTFKVLNKAAKNKDQVQVVLRFLNPKAQDVFVLDTVTAKEDKMTLRVSMEKLKALSEQYPQAVATLDVLKDGKSVLKEESYDPKIFIGGTPDFMCERPVIIVDYNNTLDSNQSCTVPAINDLTSDYNVTFFVVSTSGSSIRQPVKALNYKTYDNFLFLDNINGSYSDNEKAIRILKNLWSTGACILGFAGDSPEKEGAASNFLGIPFYAINQRDTETRINKGYETKQAEMCVYVGTEAKARYTQKNEMCKLHERSVYYPGKVECLMHFDRGGTAIRTKKWTLESGEPYCDQDEERTVINPLRYGCEIIEQVDAPFMGACPTNYEKKSVEKKVPIETVTKAHKYEPDSAYARNWCDLKEHIVKQIESKKDETQTDTSDNSTDTKDVQ